MAAYRLSKLARNDWRGILRYTYETWGEEQTRRYEASLLACLRQLASTPRIGRLYKNLRRLEHEKHVIFYSIGDSGIVIIRILHRSMLPGKHRLD